MTLILAIHNGKDIVAGSDSLAIKYDLLTREETSTYDVEKIYPVTDKAVLLLAGRFTTGTIPNFMTSFVQHCIENNIITSAQLLERFRSIARNGKVPLSRGDAIEVIIAGFNDSGSPELHCFRKTPASTEEYSPLAPYFEIAGNAGPRNRAKELIEEANISENMDTDSLEVIVRRIIKTCIEEFDELGGDPKWYTCRNIGLTGR